MKKAIVIGSGAGGATAAKELQGKFDVTVLETGGHFQPFTKNITAFERIKKSGLLFDERMIQWIFPSMRINKVADNMAIVRGRGTGGTTTLSAGNAIRRDECLKEVGINLDEEFRDIYREIPVNTTHRKKWRTPTAQVYDICAKLGLNPEITPKLINLDLCSGCGRCVLGCPRGAKWDSRQFLNQSLEKGAHLITGCKVNKIITAKGRVQEVETSRGSYRADLVVLAAGGLGTPLILQNSGIQCRPNLFVDPVLCVAARVQDSRQNQEIPMPFVIQQNKYMISPYFDFLSFFFNRKWRYPPHHIFSLMIKLADTNSGSITGNKISKGLSIQDGKNLKEAVDLCALIFQNMGISRSDLFLGTLNAGHPGGTFPLTEKEALTLHNDRLPENLYVADASLFPDSLGSPPIITIAAMAKRVSNICLKWA